MKIASWNINSLRKRQDRLFAWLEATKPDVVCLQETKCPDELFPTLALQAVGYGSAYHGEKSYNGVAILAKTELHDVRPSLCDEVYEYKLHWYQRLRDCIAKEKSADAVVCGDFNVAPEDTDVYDPDLWRGAIMCSEGERAAFRELCNIGFRDTLRIHHKDDQLFTWWDYQMRAFEKNRGLRIDAILASDELAKKCIAAGIDREMRKGKEPSDHAPVWAEFR